MSYIINRKNFEFMKDFLECPVDFDGLLFYQIGECSLSDGCAIKSHYHKNYAEKIITFEFSHFLSPQSIYPSAQNLNRLYKEYYLK